MTELFENILQASFHGSIIILAVLLMRLVLKKAPKKFLCFLWLLAGLRLLMPFEIHSDLSLQPQPAVMVQEFQQIPPAETFPDGEAREEVPVVNANDGNDQTAFIQSQTATPVVPQVTVEPEKGIDWETLIPNIWLMVAVCFGIYTLYSYIKLKIQVREAIKIPGGWESDRIDTAFILGFIRPKIYIPMGMSPMVRRHILAHERTHLEKGDHWFKMIGFLALALHWFNPLVWVAYILLCKDIEMACDERVVQFMELKERKEYSAALLKCSTNRAHFAACPVAFGEVSVKTRIKSVLHYKKPSFWVSLLGVIAIIFVAVCLVTSPEEETAEVPAAEIAPAETTEYQNVEDRAMAKVNSSFSDVLAQDCYSIEFYESTHKGSVGYQGTFYKHGENTLWETSDHRVREGHMHLDGKDYVLDDNSWVPGEAKESWVEEYVARFDLEGKEILNVMASSGTHEITGKPFEKIQFVAQWEEEDGNLITQPMTYHFDENGKFTNARIEGMKLENADTFSMSVSTDAEDVILAQFQSASRNITTTGDLEALQNERPSNHTEFDKDYALGSAQMGWQFLDGRWFMKFGAENVTNTSLKLVWECQIPYSSESVTGTMVSGDTFYIEYLDDYGIWQEYPLNGEAPRMNPKELYSGSGANMVSNMTLDINWADSYGVLPGGRYRVGIYYTFTTNDGRTDTQLCYAKFRLYAENADELLKKCRNGLDQLTDVKHFQIYEHNSVNPNPNVEPQYTVIEAWRNKANWLVSSQGFLKENGELQHGGGSMIRDGVSYTLTWQNHDPRKAVTRMETNTYMDEFNFGVYLLAFEWHDSSFLDISQSGDKIVLVESSNFGGYKTEELAFTFGNDGGLVSIIHTFIADDGTRTVEEELTVFDANEAQIDSFIDSQKQDKLPSFDWEEDKNTLGEKDTAKIGGFKNTRVRNKVTYETVQELAHAETPHYKDYPDMFSNVKEVFYDENAKMWKVSCRFSMDHTIWHDVYINDQGITQLMITREIEPVW